MLKAPLVTIALLASASGGQFIYHLPPQTPAGFTGGYYWTTFALTENPLSETAVWKNGAVDGRDWGNAQSANGRVYGTRVNGVNGGSNVGPPYDDSEAVLKGTWTSDQWTQAHVFAQNQSVTGFQEVELRLRRTLTTGVSQGYEILFSCRTGNPYVQIVRWNGDLSDFDVLASIDGPGLTTGSLVAATAQGSTITAWQDGVPLMQVTDETFTSGNPGVGFWLTNQTTTQNQDCGFSDYEASNYTTAPINGYYSTTFAATENPISEGGAWITGGADGLDWLDVQTSSGRAYGLGESASPPFSDPTAVLIGAWSGTQWASGIAFVQNQGNSSGEQEIELRLLTTITAHSITGYEILFSVDPTDPYVELVRWNGAINNFTRIGRNSSVSAPVTGDMLTASVEAGVFHIYKNGTEITMTPDSGFSCTSGCVNSTYTTGNPGIGFFKRSAAASMSDAGWDEFTASNGGLNVAASCSSANIVTAMTAAGTGDTVLVPPGTCAWTTQVTWTSPQNSLLIGAGSTTGTGGAGRTIITDNYASSQPDLLITTDAAGTFRMANLTIQAGTGQIKDATGFVHLTGQSKRLRFDHNRLDAQANGNVTLNHATMRFTGWINGVADHNDFKLHSIGNGPQVHFTGWGASGEGDTSWASPTLLGGCAVFSDCGNTVVIEDNSILSDDHFGSVDDCAHGGRYVFRYNTTNGGSQTHPTGGSGGRARGCRSWELYGNSWTMNPQGAGNENFNANFLSSGTGVIWGNTVAADAYKHFITMNNMRRDSSTYAETATPNGWGYCGTSFNGTGSNWDENGNASTGYHCLDTIGRGVGDLLTGVLPNVTNSATSCTSGSACAYPRQANEPMREWLNTGYSCSGCGGSFISVGSDFVANTDYYLYNGNASCNQGAGSCTAGMGSGTRAQRPTNCTTGVGWWSTDQGGNWNTSNGTANDGTMDLCTATNTWTDAVYTPYRYPHPLNKGY